MSKKMTKTQKKVKKVMKEFKKGKLNIGGSKKKVKNRKQAKSLFFSFVKVCSFDNQIVIDPDRRPGALLCLFFEGQWSHNHCPFFLIIHVLSKKLNFTPNNLLESIICACCFTSFSLSFARRIAKGKLLPECPQRTREGRGP